MSETAFYNPYSHGTAKHAALNTLSDLEWHCARCELPGSQPAKMLQGLRLDGWQFEKLGQNWESRRQCARCGAVTSHRRLISLERLQETKARASMSDSVRERIRSYYGSKDEILGHTPSGRTIEVDHRVPQVRWTGDEATISPTISDDEIEERFMLLTREHNLLKSRQCERCVQTGTRQAFLGVEYFYEGSEVWDARLGCRGCGWHDPAKWRAALNKMLRVRTE